MLNFNSFHLYTVASDLLISPRKYTTYAQRLMKTRLRGTSNAEHRSLAPPGYENSRSPFSLYQLSLLW